MRSLAWSPHGDILATGDYWGIVRLWDVATWTVAADLYIPGRKGSDIVHHLRFSDDGSRLVAGYWEHVATWDVVGKTGTLRWDVSRAMARAIGPDAGRVVCDNYKLLDGRTGEVLNAVNPVGPDSAEIPDAITPDGALFITKYYWDSGPVAPPDNHSLFGRDVRTLEVVERLVVPLAPPSPSEAANRTERDELMTKYLAEMRKVWEMTEPDKEFNEAAARTEVDDRIPGGPVAWFCWGAIEQPTADGGVIACEASDGNTYLVDVTRQPWRVAQVIPRLLLAWSSDGRRMALWRDGDRSRIDVYPASEETGADISVPPTCTIPLRKSEDRIYAASFAYDNTMLAIAPERSAGHESTVYVYMLDVTEAPLMVTRTTTELNPAATSGSLDGAGQHHQDDK